MAKTPTSAATAPVTVIVSEPSVAQIAAQKAADAEAAAPENAKMVAKKGDLAVAVHEIHMIGDDGRPTKVAPGEPFYPAEVDVAFLRKHEAVREPSEAERVMHERTAALQAAVAASVDETLG